MQLKPEQAVIDRMIADAETALMGYFDGEEIRVPAIIHFVRAVV